MTSTSDNQQSPNITLEQISDLIDRKLNSLTTESRSRSRSPSHTRDQTSKSPNRITDSDIKRSSIRPNEKPSKSDKFCSYCKKWFHTIDECRKRQYNERRKTESQTDASNKDTAYVITSHTESASIPSIIITPADSSESVISPDEVIPRPSIDKGFDSQPPTQATTNNINENKTEIKDNLSTNSCLYLRTEMFDIQSKFLLDTGSPYSILSLKGFEKLSTKHQFTLSTDSTKLTAADGSPIETKGKTLIEFYCEGLKFQQEFLVAKLQGIVGILGMDFLVRYDTTIKIKNHILKTSNGKLKLHKHSTRQHLNANTLSRKPNRKCPNSSCSECYPYNSSLSMDNDEGADNNGSVSITDLLQESMCSSQPTVTLSSPAPGQDDRTGIPWTLGTNGNCQSPISPIFSGTNDTRDSIPNWLPTWSPAELNKMQTEDSSIGLILQSKLTNQKPRLQELNQADFNVKALLYQWDNLEVTNDVLYRKWIDNKGLTVFQLVAPEAIRHLIFTHLHTLQTAGHFGRDRTTENIKYRYYWPGYKDDISRWVRECDMCARAKPGPGLGKSALHQFRINEVMRCVAVDIFGPLPLSENGNEYIIVLGDYYSKWVDAWAVPDHTAQTVADKLVVEFFTKFGCPAQIHTDQGREFQSELFRLVCEKFGVDQTRTAPYRPNSDGLVERFNRTLKQMLKIFSAENPKDWDDHLPYLLMAYRASPHKSTGCTPNLLFLQREVACPLDLMVGPPPNTLEDICPVQYIEWIKSAMHLTHEFVYEQLGVAATRQKTYHDHALKPRTYEIGDWVWRFYPPTANQKLGLGWTGPYLVVNKISTLTYSIQKTDVSPIINVHVNHLKPYEGRNQPHNWLNIVDESNLTDFPDISYNDLSNVLDQTENENNDLSNILDRAENESVVTNEASDNGVVQGQDKNIQNANMPLIRSRRERPIKPRQVWSPS